MEKEKFMILVYSLHEWVVVGEYDDRDAAMAEYVFKTEQYPKFKYRLVIYKPLLERNA